MADFTPGTDLASKHNMKISLEIYDKILNKIEPNLHEVVQMIDFTGDYMSVRKTLVDHKVCNYKEFADAVKKQKVKNLLEIVPENARQFVDAYAKAFDLKVNAKGEITMKRDVYFEGSNVTVELENAKRELAEETDRSKIALLQEWVEQLVSACGVMKQDITILDVLRDMRLLLDDLKIKMSHKLVEDALDDWIKKEIPRQKYDAFCDLQFRKAYKKEGVENFKKLAMACFDLSEHEADYVAAVLMKTVWMVKRKMTNRPVTNHSMPVILGPQGVGKSTFIELFTSPLEDMRAWTDFNQITDERNVDLFSQNYIAIVDEMGFAAKSEIDVVKNLISTNQTTRRPMMTNKSINIKQNATFIGASNKEIGQLIRDETGIRRFVPLRFKNDADWKVLNEMNMVSLWRAVDEAGPDPMLPFIDELRKEQESHRTIRPCEEWLRTLDVKVYAGGEFEDQTVWYSRYKEWQDQHYSKNKMDLGEWRMELLRLKNHDVTGVFPFKTKKDGQNLCFQFVGVDMEEAFDYLGDENKKTLHISVEKEESEQDSEVKQEINPDDIDSVEDDGTVIFKDSISDDDLRRRVVHLRMKSKYQLPTPAHGDCYSSNQIKDFTLEQAKARMEYVTDVLKVKKIPNLILEKASLSKRLKDLTPTESN